MNKKLILFIFLFASKLIANAQSADGVALTINGTPVYKSEIEQAYNKYNQEQKQSGKDSFAAFLQSYTDFRLNVEEAKAQRLDTTASYKREYYSYKAELGRSYLRDTTLTNNLLEKYYRRMQQDIDINHVLIPYSEKGKVQPADTLALYNRALAMRGQLLSNGFKGEGFIDNTLNPSFVHDLASVSGHLGWVTAFMLPLQLEDAVYSLPQGQVSMPIRTQRGYHLLQVISKRPAIGAVRVDQIVFSFPTIPPTAAAIDSVGTLAYGLREGIKEDSDYQSMCDHFGEVYKRGDKKCDFGIVKLDMQNAPSFIHTALSLSSVGDISEPVMTDYGYHILRLTAKIPIPEFSLVKPALTNMIVSGDRGEDYQAVIMRTLMDKSGAKINTTALSDLQAAATKADLDEPVYHELVGNRDDILLTIGGRKSYTVDDFLSFVDAKATSKINDPSELPAFMKKEEVYFNLSSDKLKSYLTVFCINKLYDYEEDTLEENYPEFEARMREYADGILFFDVKNVNVWTKAQNDETGLETYFAKSKSKYKWDAPRYKGVLFYCKSEDTKKEIEKLYLANGENEKALSLLGSTFNDGAASVLQEPGTWSEGDNPYVDNKVFGKNREIIPRHSYPYVAVIGRFISQPEDYKDVRNAVENDFQNELETKWISSLRNKYKVVQNKSVLKSIKQNK